MQYPQKINDLNKFWSLTIFMRNAGFCILFVLLAHSELFANADSTGVKIINGKLFIIHQVDAGQGLYGVARKYKTTVAKIKEANPGMGLSLSVGQVILVPYPVKPGIATKSGSETQSKAFRKQKVIHEDNSASDNKTPIYHTVINKETLNKIAENHHLTIDQLKTWNHIDLETISPGEKIIVGYKEKKVVKEIVKTDSKTNNNLTKTDKRKSKINEGTETLVTDKVPENVVKRSVTENGMGTWVDDGSIKTDISLAMHKTAPSGTIIKLTNPMNGRSKYVKVVGNLPDTDDNKDIIIKISKNTADELGIIDKDFRVKLEYSVNDVTSH